MPLAPKFNKIISNIIFPRSLDICLDNEIERIHAQKLTRKLATAVPTKLPRSLVYALVAIACDGTNERDRMVRAALACLCELSKFITFSFSFASCYINV